MLHKWSQAVCFLLFQTLIDKRFIVVGMFQKFEGIWKFGFKVHINHIRQ